MNLPDYPILDEQKYNWNLFTNDYFPWHNDCDYYNGLDRNYILEQADKSVNIGSVLGTTFTLTIIFFILSCIFVCGSYMYKKQENDEESLKSKKIYEIISVCTKTFLILIIVWYCYTNITTISSYNSSVSELATAQCSDSFSNRIFVSFSEALVRFEILNYCM